MATQKQIDEAIERLESIVPVLQQAQQSIYVAHSGGKDSVVVHDLAKRVLGYNIRVVHTPKTSGFNKTHPDTIDFLYELSVDAGLSIVPSFDMRNFLRNNNLNVQIDGTRRDEADRTDRSSNVIVDGKDVSRTEMTWFTDKGVFDQVCVFPIFDWSDDDVWSYIKERNLAVSKEYNPSTAH